MNMSKVPDNQKGFKEMLYDKLRMPLWALDVIIVLLFIVLITVIILGTR